MESPGGNGTILRPGFSGQSGRAEGNESSDQIARRSFAALPDIDCASCDASIGAGASRQRISGSIAKFLLPVGDDEWRAITARHFRSGSWSIP